MDLSADCIKMVTMKSMTVHNELLRQTVEQQSRNQEEGDRAGDGEDETKDCYSIASVSPSVAENTQHLKSSDDPEEEFVLQSLLVSPHTEDSLSNMGHHVPPLESIRELEEVDEQGSNPRRSPGDGAMRVREGVADTVSLLSSVERSNEMGYSSGDRNALSGTKLVPTFKPAVTSEERAKLDSEMADLLKYPQGAPHDSCLQVESPNMEPVDKNNGNGSCGSRVYHKEEGHNSATKISWPENRARSEESLRKNLETSVTSLEEQQDIKLKHQSHQKEINQPHNELRNSKEATGELESELSSERKEGEKQAHKIQDMESEMSNRSLTAVLTECQYKIEQLEEIKHSSMELTAQLQAAQGLAACLQRRVLCLETEHTLMQHQVLGLTEELEAARNALQEKSAEMAHVTAQLHILQQQRENVRESVVCSADVLANGHTTMQPHSQPKQNSNDSKVCTLL